MKKVISLVLTAILLVGLLAVSVSADSYIYYENEALGTTVKKADPSVVVKDGVISAGEYERFIVNNNPDSDECDLCVVYDNGDYYDKAETMMRTAEFYFSWDDVHGLNVAVRYKPETIKQVLDVEEGDKPGDNFLKNTGILLFLDYRHEYGNNDNLSDIIYYAAGKRTTDGKYLLGHYGQLGVKGDYAAHPGDDLVIEYGADGYVTCEWSVPIENVIKGSFGDGTNIYITLSLMAGDDDTADGGIENFYGVGLGYYGYAMKATGEGNHCTLTLSSEALNETKGGTGSEDNPGEGEPGQKGARDITNDPDSPVTDPANPDNTVDDKPSTKTGDIAAVLAVVSVLSAGGIMLGKKRK